MKKCLMHVAPVLLLALLTYSCQKNSSEFTAEVIPQEVINQLTHLGFNTEGIARVEKGYLIERDIIITDEFLQSNPVRISVPNMEQYSTNNLVYTNGGRVITIYASTDGPKGLSAGIISGLDVAIARYNTEGLKISFQRVTSPNGADIVMTRLSKGRERQGTLGSTGFPTAGGDPYNEINVNGILESGYGLNTNQIASIIAHQIGHSIGFRHTDYFNPSISCGGLDPNELVKIKKGIGANHIPGTPTGATFSAQSFMLSCAGDGSDRPFNNDDKIALAYLY